MKSTGNSDLDSVLKALEEGGASRGELNLARQRGQELLDQYGENNDVGSARFVLDTLKSQYGLTSPEHDRDQRNTRRSALDILNSGKDLEKRGNSLSRWIRGDKEREGD